MIEKYTTEKYDNTTGQYYETKNDFYYYLTNQYKKQHEKNSQAIEDIFFYVYGKRI